MTLVTFIYSLVIFRRLRKYEDYHLTANVKHFGFRGDDTEMGNKVRISATNGRAVSVGSIQDMSYGSDTTGLARTTSGGSMGSEPYSHQRDTLYEGYLERHAPMLLGSGSFERPPSGRLDRSDSFVGTGFVHAATATAESGDDVVRRVSERGLVTVPEDADEYGTGTGGRDGAMQTGRRRAASEEDTRALLAPRGSDEVETDKPGHEWAA